MKNSILYFAMALMLFSCSNEIDDTTSIEVTGKWTLVRMGASFTNTITTGANMEWQEYYIFNEDGTFIKSRERNGTITEAFGTFISTTTNSTIQLDLVFNSESEIIGTCVGPVNETLAISSNNVLKSSWLACDGPRLEYKKRN
jgi:hypothetical protein